MVNCEIACLLARQIGMQLLYSLHKLYMSTFNTKLTDSAVAWKWIMNYLKLKVRYMRRLKKYMRHARFIDKHTKKKKKIAALWNSRTLILDKLQIKRQARSDISKKTRYQSTKALHTLLNALLPSYIFSNTFHFNLFCVSFWVSFCAFNCITWFRDYCDKNFKLGLYKWITK